MNVPIHRLLTGAAIVLSLLFLLPVPPSWAGSPPRAGAAENTHPEPLVPEFITSSPVIDGNLDEPFWKQAPHVTGFKTYSPDFDVVPKEQTEVYLAYDRENLYFAFRCYDDVTKIKASISARDKMTQDDWVCINLDSFNDQQALTAFYVNPLGIQGDSRFAAGTEDFSPDFVWYSAGRIDSLGYTVEIQLPLKSLRYANGEPTTMGVILERYISRRSEHSTFPRLDPAKGYSLLTQMFPIAYSDVEQYKLLEILPAVTATRQDVRRGNSLERDKQESELSLTAKYGITSDLILDGTTNPDFSQVESDAGQIDVNLRFSLFYPEKRPFFLEGQDNFKLGSSGTPLDPTIFYSRTIADPLIGTKLTGKISNSNTIAAVYSVDNVLESDRNALGRYAHVPVIRYKHALSDDSYLGFLFAGRELEHTNNRVAGFDEQYRISESAVLESNGFLSWAKEDPAGSSVDGHTFGARLSSSARNVDYNLSLRKVSDNFTADMGYLTRTGVFSFAGSIIPKFYPASDFFQRIDLQFSPSLTHDHPSDLWETNNDAGVTVYFSGNWRLRTLLNYSTEIFNGKRFQTPGGLMQLRAYLTKNSAATLLLFHSRIIYYPASEQGRSNAITATLTLQPSDNLLADGSWIYADFFRDSDDAKLYGYAITRLKLTYQMNQYLFFRGIAEYNENKAQLTTDFLASFTYIPGTAFYVGYGSVFSKLSWDGTEFVPNDRLIETQRGLFLKMSYLWRS